MSVLKPLGLAVAMSGLLPACEKTTERSQPQPSQEQVVASVALERGAEVPNSCPCEDRRRATRALMDCFFNRGFAGLSRQEVDSACQQFIRAAATTTENTAPHDPYVPNLLTR